MKRTGLLFAGVLLLCATNTYAAVKGKAVEYHHGDTVLEGYLAYDDAVQGPRPGILVVHEWKGLNDYAKRRAEQLAQLGYVAFAADMYGKGVHAKDHKEAAELSGIYRSDRQLMRARITAALNRLKEAVREQPKEEAMVDPNRIAAIGYCFGGMTVLELARSGADVRGVVSFHGGLDTPNPNDAKQIKGKVLVLHGADDRFITQEQVKAFEAEMDAARVDYQLIQYPGAVHSFTVPEAGNDVSTGMAYNAAADQQSWKEMKRFLENLFSDSPRSIRGVKSRYERKFPVGKPWPVDLSKAQVIKDKSLVMFRLSYWKTLNTPPEEVKKLLSTYLVVPEEEWTHGFSHVAGGDQAGWIEFPDQSRVQWALRPGGLAWIMYPDGGVVYLSACRSNPREAQQPSIPCGDARSSNAKQKDSTAGTTR